MESRGYEYYKTILSLLLHELTQTVSTFGARTLMAVHFIFYRDSDDRVAERLPRGNAVPRQKRAETRARRTGMENERREINRRLPLEIAGPYSALLFIKHSDCRVSTFIRKYSARKLNQRKRLWRSGDGKLSAESVPARFSRSQRSQQLDER